MPTPSWSSDRILERRKWAGSMKASYITVFALSFSLLLGCTYEGLRMQERRDCGAMPQSQAERCFARTSMTKQEYDTEREKLESAEGDARSEKKTEIDPRYEKWIP
jgi:hypothetical protein